MLLLRKSGSNFFVDSVIIDRESLDIYPKHGCCVAEIRTIASLIALTIPVSKVRTIEVTSVNDFSSSLKLSHL